MTPKIYTVKLDIYKGLINYQDIVFTIEDYNQCVLNFEITNNGAPYDLTDCITRLNAKNGSTTQQQDCELILDAQGKATIILEQRMFANRGTWKAEIQIYDNINQVLRLTIPQFRYYARLSLMDDVAIKSDPEFSVLQNIMLDAKETLVKADTAIDDALQAVMTVNNQVDLINVAVADVNQATVTASDALSIASSAEASANNAVVVITDQVDIVNDAAQTANGAVTNANNANTTANTAIETANNASTVATQANATANSANTTAGNAVTQANAAVTTINAQVANVNAAVTEVDGIVAEWGPLADTIGGKSTNEFVTEMPIVANRLKNTFYWKTDAEGNVEYVENSDGVRFDITQEIKQSFANLEGLVQGVIDTDITAVLENELVATNIANKLNAKETEYAPRLTSAEAQLLKKVQQADNSFLATIGKGVKQPLLTFVTDDGRATDYTVFKDIFAPHGIGCTTAVVTSRVGIGGHWASLEQIKELQDVYGWEVVSHSSEHADLRTLSDPILLADLKGSRQWLIDKGFKGYDHLMLPYGYFDNRVKMAVAKVYKSCRNTNQGINEMPFSAYELMCHWVSTSTAVSTMTGHPVNTSAHFKGLIDNAIATNRWLIIFTHSWEIEQWGYQQMFSEIVAYASSKSEIKKVGFTEAFELCGNIVDQASYANAFDDQFVIGSNGVVKSNIAKTKLLAPNSLTFTTPPLEIPQGYMSTCNITGANATSFPQATAGTLISYNFQPTYSEPTNRAYCWQEYHLYGSNKFYRRRGTTSGWGDFAEFGGSGTESSYNIATTGTYTGLTLPNAFPLGATTVIPITDAIASQGGFPTSLGGILTTHVASKSSSIYGYQIYKQLISNTIWTRYPLTVTTWSAWVRLTPLAVSTTARNAGAFNKVTGEMAFDTTLNKPIWYTGANWVDAIGTVV